MTRVTFDTAKLLHEESLYPPVGRKIVGCTYTQLGGIYTGKPMGSMVYDFYPAPTQSELQKWFRELDGWPIEILQTIVLSDKPRKYKFSLWRRGEYVDVGLFSKYEDGLEESLQRALKLLKEHKID